MSRFKTTKPQAPASPETIEDLINQFVKTICLVTDPADWFDEDKNEIEHFEFPIPKSTIKFVEESARLLKINKNFLYMTLFKIAVAELSKQTLEKIFVQKGYEAMDKSNNKPRSSKNKMPNLDELNPIGSA